MGLEIASSRWGWGRTTCYLAEAEEGGCVCLREEEGGCVCLQDWGGRRLKSSLSMWKEVWGMRAQQVPTYSTLDGYKFGSNLP
jgi:hypothetical protein